MHELDPLDPVTRTPRLGRDRTLDRAMLSTSRLMDFFSVKELTTQTGHASDDWPLVVLKELVDNALDACEEGGAAPIIHVRVGGDGITVVDNGPGIPGETVRGVVDFSTRVSSREAYVAPDRGAQGNALMTILAMPFVLDGAVGVVEVTGRGFHHVITIRVDHLRQEPVIDHKQVVVAGNAGTVVRLGWPDSARSTLEAARTRFLQVWSDYGLLNPHLTGTLEWFDEQPLVIEATDTGWRKWTPSQPTSPHWYTPDQFGRLICGYLASADRCDRTVREVVAEFRGLSGTAKQKAILEATGLGRRPLSALWNGEGLDHEAVAGLLAVMQAASKPVRPALLGVIGKSHVSQRLTDLGCHPDSITYAKQTGDDDGVPWVVEQAFGYRPGDAIGGVIIAGVNWSPALGNPFRQLDDDYGMSLDRLLERQRVRLSEPVVVFVHLAQAHVSYTDRGKSAVVVN